MRQVATIAHYLATTSHDGIQIHHFASARISASLLGEEQENDVVLAMTSAYPWRGTIQIVIERSGVMPWTLALRIPAWCSQPALRVNGRPHPAPSAGYAHITRAWQPGDNVELALPMIPRLVGAHPYVENLNHRVAIECGPLVYCLEADDQEPNLELRHISIRPDARLQTKWQSDLLGGIMTVETTGMVADLENWDKQLYRPLSPTHFKQQEVSVTAIPYFAWANRGAGAMRLWLPLADKEV
jgi:DUF1680 family protein